MWQPISLHLYSTGARMRQERFYDVSNERRCVICCDAKLLSAYCKSLLKIAAAAQLAHAGAGDVALVGYPNLTTLLH